jgi:hypothetical protein
MANLDGVRRLLEESVRDHTRALTYHLDALQRDLQTAYEEFGAESEIYGIVQSRYFKVLESATNISNSLGEHKLWE